jgi:hypothetical protein
MYKVDNLSNINTNIILKSPKDFYTIMILVHDVPNTCLTLIYISKRFIPMYLPTTKPWHVTWFFKWGELFLGAKLNDSLIFHEKINWKTYSFILEIWKLTMYIVCTLENQIDEIKK